MMLETAVIATGKVVSERAGRLWLADRRNKADQNKELLELIRVRFRDQIAQRRVERQLLDVADTVADRILRLCGHEYSNLGENDKEAAVLAAADCLTVANLSDETLFHADVDPIKLARDIRSSLSSSVSEAILGEAGFRLYEVILDESCDCLVRIVRGLPNFGARADVEILNRISQLSQDISSVLARLPVRSLDAPDGTADDDEFRSRYLEEISTSLDCLELFGVRVERFRPRTSLTVSYISLSVSAPGLVSHPGTEGQIVEAAATPIEEWRRPIEPATLRVESALGRSRLTLIRGEAGSGKSTLLRWLAVTASRGAFTGNLIKWNGSIPFLIKLRSFAEQGLPPPEQFLSGVADVIKDLMPAGWVHRQLKSGRALLLVDGVDELPGSMRRLVRPWLQSLIRNTSIRVVVTSRPATAKSDWLAAEGFTPAFLERMSPNDVRSLILHWHTAMRDAPDLPCTPVQLVTYEAALLARLEAAPHLQILASNPLLATMLCALNLDRDRQLPRDRMGLYAAVLGLLLERRDVERHIPGTQDIAMERSQKIQILQDLAWRLSTTSRSELSRDLVLRRIVSKIENMPRVNASAEEVLDHLLQRSGILREPAIGRIDFIHRTVQEYLTAQQAADDGDMQPVIDNAHRDQWHEIVVMAAGHANMPLREELLRGLLCRAQVEPRYARRMKLLVAACLETLPAVPKSLNNDIERCLGELVPPRDYSSARSLALVGEPILDRLPDSLDGFSVPVARAIVRTAWLVNGPQALDVLARYGNEPRQPVQIELVRGWRYFDPIEYATRVLGHTPFADGYVNIDSAALLGSVKILSQCNQLRIDSDTIISNLSFTEGLSRLTHFAIESLSVDSIENLPRFLPKLTHLRLNLRGRRPSLEPLSRLEDLTYLSIRCEEEFDNLEFVMDLTKLTEISIDSVRNVRDFAPLGNRQDLKTLRLAHAQHLTDIDQLPSLQQVDDLALRESSLSCGLEEVVARAPRLRILNLRGAKWVKDLTGLATLDLTELELWDCEGVTDLAPLARMRNLAYLDLDNTGVSDLTPLANLQSLRSLDLSNCANVTDLSPLASINGLRSLFVDGLPNGVDLRPLAANKKLRLFANSGAANTDLFRRRITLVD